MTHPLDNIDKQFRFAGASFGASAIGTLRRCVKQHFRFLQPDLDTLQTCDLTTLLNSIPVSCEPVAPEAPQQQQTVDITVPQQQQTARRPIPADKNLFNAILADPSAQSGQTLQRNTPQGAPTAGRSWIARLPALSSRFQGRCPQRRTSKVMR